MKSRRILLFLVITVGMLITGCASKEKSVETLFDLTNAGKDSFAREVYLLENGLYVPYIVLSSDYKGQVLLLRKNIMNHFKAIGNYSAEYQNSSIDQYLSSEYLSLFPDEFVEKIVTVDIEVTTKDSLYSTDGETETISRKAFLLSYTEMNYSEHSMAVTEGKALRYFSDDKSRIAYWGNKPSGWWLRTPYTGYDSVTWAVDGSGMKTELSSSYENGIRPAICLPKTIAVMESTEVIAGKSVYIIE